MTDSDDTGHDDGEFIFENEESADSEREQRIDAQNENWGFRGVQSRGKA